MKYLISFILLGVSFSAFSQWGVGFHQSYQPFAAVNYEFNERWRAEGRIGTDRDIESLSVELLGLFNFVRRDEYEIYTGLGFHALFYYAAVVPIGINLYPFENKRFGFHIEFAPMIDFEDEAIFRGSWGIRYRFLKE